MLPTNLAAIKKLSLFADLDAVRDSALIDKIQIKSFPAGEFIFHEGEAGDQLFVIKSGEVEIVRIADGMAEEVAFLEPGDVFGELGALGQKTRNASARAFSNSEVLILDRPTATQLAADVPSFDLLVGKRFIEREKARAEIDYQKA
ncbi:MAG: cyclic nucleotide-binding domain-containing protein [Patescibacteria group bacterium]